MKRRTKWILGLSIGIPVVLIAGGLLALRLTSSNPELDLASIEVKELPGTWEQDPSIADVTPSDAAARDDTNAPTVSDTPKSEAVIAPLVLAPTIEDFGLPISGTLIMMNEGKLFGEESFELALETGDVMLRSNGRFWFKALIATITLKYDQILQMDSHLRPTSLASSFDAPLGFGRDIQADFADGGAVVRSGKNVEEFSVDLDRAYVLGTFSTYAIIPLLYELREFEGSVSLETLVFGGPPSQDNESQEDGLPETIITKMDDTMIRFGDQQLTVSQYEISGDMGVMMLYARGIELLGVYAGDDEESMFAYRADYFEDGFEVVDGDRLLSR